MNTEVRKILANLDKQWPDWKTKIKEYLTEEITVDNALSNDFWSAITAICDIIKSDECTIDDAVKSFVVDLQPEIQSILKNRLRPFFAFSFLRKYEDKKALEFLIDDVWAQNVIRRNPGYMPNPRSHFNLDISVDEMTEFTVTLNALVDHCISRLYNFDGSAVVFQMQTGISRELSEHIARKIERDDSELRFNYVIRRLRNLGNQ